MPYAKGTLSPESIAKMRAAKLGKKRGPQSDEHRAKIGAAHRGRVHAARYDRTCPCGTMFSTAASNARYCSHQCKRAAKGHGLRHAPEYRVFAQQCAICARADELVGDHDHETGKPRGILCRTCNLAIGNMRDNPALLRAAAAYLERQP